MDINDILADTMWIGVRSWNTGIKVLITHINYEDGMMQVLINKESRMMWSLDILMGYKQDLEYSFYKDVLRL